MTDKVLRIGGASGFWGDAARATPQLLNAPGLDYIVYDYLAEITMSIMARARSRDESKGYALDFVSAAMKPNLATIADSAIKVVSNAGGVNPQACANALRAEIAAQGLTLKVACVVGDDLLAKAKQLQANGVTEMFSREAFPNSEKLQSINAYLGAFPIAKALEAGADIVITGRCVDSAVTLGACIHAFGWERSDWDKLAMGSLAGHILECGKGIPGNMSLDLFSDTNYAPDDPTERATTCGTCFIDGMPYSCFARRQAVQSTSSRDAEFYGASSVVVDGKVIWHLFEWLGYDVTCTLAVDSAAAKGIIGRFG